MTTLNVAQPSGGGTSRSLADIFAAGNANLRRQQTTTGKKLPKHIKESDFDLLGDTTGRDALRRGVGETAEQAGKFRSRSDSTREETLGKIRGFDPFGFAQQVAQANFAQIGDNFRSMLGSIGSGRNRRGLFGSALGEAGATRHASTQLARGLASGGFEAARLEGQNIDRLAGVAAADRGEAFEGETRQLEVASAQADVEQGRENFVRELQERRRARAEEKKRRKKGFFGKLVGGIGGAIVGGVTGGPAGAFAGAKSGASLGGSIFGG